jgi:hypothetical protein
VIASKMQKKGGGEMTKAEILSTLKKPLITLIISVIVLVISLFSLKQLR